MTIVFGSPVHYTDHTQIFSTVCEPLIHKASFCAYCVSLALELWRQPH